MSRLTTQTHKKYKRCPRCLRKKLTTSFYKSTIASDGLQSQCKKCQIERTMAWHKENPERAVISRRNRAKKRRWSVIYKKYSISPAEYHVLLSRQKGQCAICKRKPYGIKPLFVDHCHKTNKVRGLLCSLCNTGLGSFSDDALLLTAALKYLKGSR